MAAHGTVNLETYPFQTKNVTSALWGLHFSDYCNTKLLYKNSIRYIIIREEIISTDNWRDICVLIGGFKGVFRAGSNSSIDQ